MTTESDSPLKDILIGKMTKAWAENNQIPVHYEAQVESTNSIAKKLSLDDNDFRLFITDHQTQGRGRGQNTWTSPKGSGLISTWGFYLNSAPQPPFTSRVGLALWKALKSTWCFVPFALKAPNDIYVGDKKIAGILIETVTQGNEITSFIGIGLNVFSFPETISNSSSLIHSFPKNTPLLGSDWLHFMDKLFFELTEAVSEASELLNSTERANLKEALNQFTELKIKYTDVSEKADLITENNKISWNQL